MKPPIPSEYKEAIIPHHGQADTVTWIMPMWLDTVELMIQIPVVAATAEEAWSLFRLQLERRLGNYVIGHEEPEA